MLFNVATIKEKKGVLVFQDGIQMWNGMRMPRVAKANNRQAYIRRVVEKVACLQDRILKARKVFYFHLATVAQGSCVLLLLFSFQNSFEQRTRPGEVGNGVLLSVAERPVQALCASQKVFYG